MSRRHAPEELDDKGGPLFELAEKRAAEERRDDGIARAKEHAPAGFHSGALAAVREFARTHSEPFLCEQVRASMPFVDVDGRAFGAVMQEARRKGWIQKHGFAAAASSNLSPKVQWVSRICGHARES